MANRFDRLNNSSPAEQSLQADRVSVGRTAFDYSCIHNGNAIIGALTPVDCFEIVPNEDIDLSLSSLLEFRNPTTRQLFNGMRVYFHAYYNRLTDLWEGAKNWLDNGRSGNISLTRPRLIYKGFLDDKTPFNACTPMSLLNYLGLPAESVTYYNNSGTVSIASPLNQFKANVIVSSTSDVPSGECAGVAITDNAMTDTLFSDGDFFPADCAMAYQRNWRDFYAPKNLLQDNLMWFPNNEDHFILSYSCTRACVVNYENEDYSANSASDSVIFASCKVSVLGSPMIDGYDPTVLTDFSSYTPEPNCPSPNINKGSWSDYAPNLSGLKFRQFKGDRFTASSPFSDLIRGDIPTVTLNMSDVATVYAQLSGSTTKYEIQGTAADTGNLGGSEDDLALLNRNGESWNTSGDYSLLADFSGSASITMSDIYTLETLTAFRRRLGLTNGDYNEMIKSQYGVSPNVHDHRGTYIGGFYQDFAFSSVTQQSQSTADSPLGQKAGQGVSSGSGTIGHFHSPDFGWIQIYMSIVPDVYYTQGKPRQFSKKSNLEMYFPLFNNLPAQSIRNDELYISSSSTDNETPFSYEDRYAEFKSRNNRVSGFMGLSPSIASYDASRVIARRFDTTPSFSSRFVTMIPENVDYNVFSVVDEPPFDFSIGISCRRVSPMPYTAIEGSLSSPMLNNMGA